MLTDLYQALDGLLSERSDVLKVHVLNDSYTLVTGLPQRTCDHLKTMATLALSMLSMARTFTIRSASDSRAVLPDVYSDSYRYNSSISLYSVALYIYSSYLLINVIMIR